ncbi:MAG: protein kinase [Anaerolineae bacterium]|nr:protein kinase [Anaerolineae bacterium]
MTNLIGQTIGQYKVTGKIGEGGMAVVYRARQESLDRDIALKVLLPQLTADATFVERFFQEARAAAKMTHPNIVTIHDVGQANGVYYIAMAHIDGVSLADMLRQGPLPPFRAAHIIGQIAHALDYAHSQGIIHRDVKPGNILVTRDDHAFLTDFGIAKAALESSRLTRTGTMVGTPAYMAPEQAKGQPVSGQTDQYALAVVAYEMLTGHPPFDADTSHAILYQHVHQSPDLNWLPLPYQAVLGQALAKEPEQRFPTVADFGRALDNTGRGQSASPSSQTPVSTPLPTPTPDRNVLKKRVPVWVWAGSAAAVLVILLMVFTSISSQNAIQSGYTATVEAQGTATIQVRLTAAQSTLGAQRTATTEAKSTAIAQQTQDTVAAQTQQTATIEAQHTATVEMQNTVLAQFTLESQRIATAKAESVATSQAVETASARAWATTMAVTAEAQYAATARAAEATATAVAAVQAEPTPTPLLPLFGPVSGELVMEDDDLIEDYFAGVSVRDFLVAAIFFNPYSASTNSWNYGFSFRHQGYDEQLRLIIFSNNTWELRNGPNNSIAGGSISNLNTGDNEANVVVMIVKDDGGELYINDEVAYLDLSARTNYGDIAVATDFINGEFVDGAVVRYQDFTIFGLE